MSTGSNTKIPSDEVVRFRDVIHDGGHAWVLAHDAEHWFYECLKCGDRVHILSIADMNKAFEHHYAYMPLNHRAPWNQAKPITMIHESGERTVEQHPPYPPCAKADAPLPEVSLLKRGPVVAVPQDDE